MYEIIRTIYSNTSPDTVDGARVAVLQQTLSQLRLANIATLDACMNHFTRLIDLTSADEDYISALATNIGPCILRPKTETSLTLEEKHVYRLIRDLFAHKDAIFNELKRMSTPGYNGTLGRTSARPRAISTDESNRKANMEERNRLLLEKSAGGARGRASSPAPARGHRRDRSTGGPETRFPIAGSGVQTERHRSSLGSMGSNNRQSLEVPGGEPAPAPATAPAPAPTAAPTAAEPPNGETNSESDSPRHSLSQSPVEKRNSLTRSAARFSSGRRLPVNLSQDSTPRAGTPTRGVTLEDKPMED